MRPVPAQRFGHAHGLLRALEQRGKLRLEDFVTDFSEAELFPPGLEDPFGQTRPLLAYARAAGLVREERGTVELTSQGKRYVQAGDPAAVFEVSPRQAEWLRRQLSEKHLIASVWTGAAIALSLYASLDDGEWVATVDVGRVAAHLGRAGWDDAQTLRSQGDRLTHLLADMELIDAERRLTATGRATIAELRLPEHPPLAGLAAELHPQGADGAARAAAEEREALGLVPPAAESSVAPADVLSENAIRAPEDDPAEESPWVVARPDDKPIAGPDEPTRTYRRPGGAAAGLAGSSVAEAAAPELPAQPPPPAAAGLKPQPTEETAMSEHPDPGPSFQSGIRPRTAITALRPEDLAILRASEDERAGTEPGASGGFLDADAVRAAAERRGLVLDAGVYAAAVAALASGRHLVLTGGAGSGKTSLALAIADAAVGRGHCKSVLLTGAGSGASASEAVARAIEQERWLVVDELDRVALDESLGPVSTVLGGQAVDASGREVSPPAGWRLIATMADIEQVGRTSQALRRRFVFVEVPVLERAHLETLVDAWAGDDEIAAAVGRRLVAINDVVPLGPGLYRDAVSYVKARHQIAGAELDDLVLEALAGFVLPQLEGEGDDVAARAVRAAGFDG